MACRRTRKLKWPILEGFPLICPILLPTAGLVYVYMYISIRPVRTCSQLQPFSAPLCSHLAGNVPTANHAHTCLLYPLLTNKTPSPSIYVSAPLFVSIQCPIATAVFSPLLSATSSADCNCMCAGQSKVLTSPPPFLQNDVLALLWSRRVQRQPQH